MTKPERILDELRKGPKREVDLLDDFESKGNTRLIKHRIRNMLGKSERLVVEGGYWCIKRLEGVVGMIILLLILGFYGCVMYNLGAPNSVYECTEKFGVEAEWVN